MSPSSTFFRATCVASPYAPVRRRSIARSVLLGPLRHSRCRRRHVDVAGDVQCERINPFDHAGISISVNALTHGCAIRV